MEENGEWFRNSLRKIEFLYNLCGLRLYNTTNYVKLRCICLLHFLNLNSELAASTYWFFDGLASGKDFITLTYTGPCILYSYMVIIKIIYVVSKENLMHELIGKMTDIEENSKRFISSSERREIVGSDVKFLHGLIKLQNIVHVVLMLGFIAAPMSFVAVKYFKTGELELVLPLFCLYPFDPFDIRVWPFVYFHQNLSTAVVLINALAADIFLYICCTYINIQFRLLQHEVKRIIPSAKYINKLSDRRTQKSAFEEKFKRIVKWHQEVIRSAEMLEILYSKSTLFNFVSSSVSICLTLFNVTVIKDVAYIITFLSFLSMGLLQIFFLCYFGNMISQSSIELSDAAYNILWYHGGSYTGKYIGLMMIRSQKPCKLTAHGFADVNLKAFMRILSNAWSYFALLKTIYD